MAPAEGAAAAPIKEDRFGAQKSRALQRREQMRGAVGATLGLVAPGAYPGQSDAGQPDQRPCRGPGSRPAAGSTPWACGEGAAAEPARRIAGGAPVGGVPGAAAYAEALAAQVSEKQAAKAAQLAQDRRGGGSEDDRVRREAGQLAAEARGEESRQRQREAAVLAREDSLTRFLAEKSFSAGPGDELEARRRAVPGLCGPPTPAGPPGARRGCAGHRGSPTALRSRPPRGACPRVASGCDDQVGTLPQQRAPGAGTSANVWACGADQNCGNFLSDKPTSRVLKPPGGGGSLQIGAW